MDAYEAKKGELTEKPALPSKPIDQPYETCQAQMAELTVIVRHSPVATAVKGATVEIQGPTPGKTTHRRVRQRHVHRPRARRLRH